MAAYTQLAAFVSSLEQPRRVVLLVPAGKPVEAAIASLLPLLDKGDVIVDMGNEWFELTEARQARVTATGVHFMGCGLSGGGDGARNGPCLLPGGNREAWELMRPLLEVRARSPSPAAGSLLAHGARGHVGTHSRPHSRRRCRLRCSPESLHPPFRTQSIAARVSSSGGGSYPCVRYVGPGGAGQYSKMVHNGIEYGDMQLIAEATHLCRELGGLDAPAVAALLSKLNGGSLDSFLMETTAAVYLKKDPQPACAGKALVRSTRPAASRCSKPCTACLVSAHTPRCSLCPLRRAPVDGSPQVDAVFDSCGSKGTGKWTIQQAAELGVPASTHAAALEARYLSSLKAQRVTAADMFPDAGAATEGGLQDGWQRDLEDALLASKLCSYAQGMAHLRAASEKYDWNLQLHELAEIWQGGCIIRAKVLHLVQAAFAKDPRLPNLLLDEAVAAEMRARLPGWRRFVLLAMRHGVPVPALSASLTYFDTFRTSLLRSAQCIQAQRDCFGGHGFQRLDMPGTHTVTWR